MTPRLARSDRASRVLYRNTQQRRPQIPGRRRTALTTQKGTAMTQHSPILTRPVHGGTQSLYLLVGGFAAYGGRELAVIRYDGEGADDFGLTYDTPITDDVLGHLSPDEVDPLLDSIAALPNPVEVSA